MKKAIIIYDTRFGNTEKVAKALARGMESKEVDVDCVQVDKADVKKLNDYDLFVIGGPTQMHGISKPMKSFLEKLRIIDAKGTKAFAFDTKVKAWWAGSAGKGIEKVLKRLGMNIVKSYSSAIVMGREGPLENRTEEVFTQIGAEIAEAIS